MMSKGHDLRRSIGKQLLNFILQKFTGCSTSSLNPEGKAAILLSFG